MTEPQTGYHSRVESKPYEVLYHEMCDAESTVMNEIQALDRLRAEKSILLDCIRANRDHFQEMMQNG